MEFIYFLNSESIQHEASTNLSKSILTAKIPKASGKAVNKCPALGYSTPGAGSARSAQVTLCGSQNLSFQNQAERAAMFQFSGPRPQVSQFVIREKRCVKAVARLSCPCVTCRRTCHTQLYRTRVKTTRIGAKLPARIFKIRILTASLLLFPRLETRVQFELQKKVATRFTFLL